MKNPLILVLNSGSSSIKFSFYQKNKKLIEGSFEEIFSSPSLHLEGKVQKFKTLKLSQVLSTILKTVDAVPVIVGHRVVCGSEHFIKATHLTKKKLQKLKELIPLAPLHLPPQIKIIEQMQKLLPKAFQVACFDSAFFSTMPEVATTLPLEKKLRSLGIRKYGFHGLSHEYVSQKVNSNKRGVIAHLGSGASLSLIHKKRPLDTTMSFSPTSGVIMGTRTGDIDPSILLFLLRNKYKVSEIEDLINHKSGLLGISGLSADMHELLKRKKNKKAFLAIELFCQSIQKTIGSLASVTNGIDFLVFTGGIGEKSPEIRRKICEKLRFLGIEIDRKKNQEAKKDISHKRAKVKTFVLNTDENLMITKKSLEVFYERHP